MMGAISIRARWLIAAACCVTLLLAEQGMQSIWDVGGLENYRANRLDAFWYTSALPVFVAIALGVMFAPPFRLSRFVRVAVLLPVLHVGCVIFAWTAWSAVQQEADRIGGYYSWLHSRFESPSAWVAIIAPVMLVAAIAIKRKRGEWAQSFAMLSLAFLLLVGLWMPFAGAWSAGEIEYRSVERWSHWSHEFRVEEYTVHHFSSTKFLLVALVPSGLAAIAFTAVAMRKRSFWARNRGRVAMLVKCFVPLSALMLAAQADKGAIAYLSFAYVIVFAAVVVIVALVVLGLSVWIRSHYAMHRLRTLPHHAGTIVGDESAAAYEIASWLRGPRLVSRHFAISTAYGDVPIDGAELVVPIPMTTTSLAIGDTVDVLAPGTKVVIAGHARSTDGPFRGADAAQVQLVAVPGAAPSGFADVALVVWRPAVAYLAILIAVAVPPIAMFLTA
jgi:hypothetical protein